MTVLPYIHNDTGIIDSLLSAGWLEGLLLYLSNMPQVHHAQIAQISSTRTMTIATVQGLIVAISGFLAKLSQLWNTAGTMVGQGSESHLGSWLTGRQTIYPVLHTMHWINGRSIVLHNSLLWHKNPSTAAETACYEGPLGHIPA